MAYQTSRVNANSFISFVTFSCWDHTAGPVVKCVWTPQQKEEPSSDKIISLAQLTLKQEAKRDPKNPVIDFNIHFLPSYQLLIHSTLFGGRCKSFPGQRVYCLTLGIPLTRQDFFTQHMPVIEVFLHHHILIYRAILHKVRFELKSVDLVAKTLNWSMWFYSWLPKLDLCGKTLLAYCHYKLFDIFLYFMLQPAALCTIKLSDWVSRWYQ